MQLLPAALTRFFAPRVGPREKAFLQPSLRCCRTSCAAWCAVVALSSGCAPVAETMIAPQNEYLAYREIRTTRDLEARLVASAEYMDRFPDGQWSGEVGPWFRRAEAKYFESRRESAAGLAAYLRILPRGPHAAEARGALEVRRAQARADRREQLGTEARFTEERLAALALEREHARDAVSGWLGRLLAIETWGERTSHLDSEFLYEWRMEPPAAVCKEDRCTKSLSLPFRLPGSGDEASRMLVVDVVLNLEDGSVAEARMQGPALFSRMYEASTSRPVRPEDLSARVGAIAFMVEVARGAAEARLPASRCARDPVAPVVLSLDCDGWTVSVRAAADPAEDDEVIVRGPRNALRTGR